MPGYQGDEYQAGIDDCIEPDAPCSCGDCTWQGPYDDLQPIGGCVLTPGHPSPAGRCPECDALAYIDKGDFNVLKEIA